MLSKNARAGARLDDEREWLVVPSIVARAGTVPGADVMEVRCKVGIGSFVRTGKAVCVIVKAKGEDGCGDGLVNCMVQRGERQEVFEVL